MWPGMHTEHVHMQVHTHTQCMHDKQETRWWGKPKLERTLEVQIIQIKKT